MVKRWFYQQNLRADTNTHISQNVPTTLQETIEHAQRFEDARKPAPSQGSGGSSRNNNGKSSANPTAPSDESKKAKPARRHDPEFIKNATCNICGNKGHIAPDCPDKGKPCA
ncbi:hypothetical protein PI124_g18415 [Phytophthora idaei]|nr:hypothetical protein PI125_g19269 [Phytophthora idaei]KAG3133534.1 hypothetical protein PI126_g19138 [Phytophthora idaei]KAG3236577.1 hypothetical protein PI124_g18415 [Phytophthora idaei]